MSADGARAAWFDPLRNDEWQLRVGEIGGESSRKVVSVTGRPMALYWIDQDRILCVLDRLDEGRHFYLVQVEAGHARPIVKAAGRDYEGPRLVSLARADDGVILVSNDLRIAWEPDLYHVDLDSGVVTLQEQNPGGVYRWFSDADGLVRLATAWRAAGQGVRYDLLFRQRSYDSWSPRHRYRLGEPALSPLGFTPASDRILVSAVSDGDTAALFAFDPHTARLGSPLYRSHQADIESVIYAGGTTAPALIEYEALRPQRAVLDADWRRHLALLEARIGDLDYRIQQTTPDGRYALVMAYGDREPGRYLRFDAARGELVEVGRRLPRIDSRSLLPTQPLRFLARDGLPLSGYFTAPVGRGPHPLVVLVHGGPWARDRWGYNPAVQYLASQGLAVLQVNFRGSRGLGHKLLHSGRRAWGRSMQDDLVDGVDALVKRKLVDPSRVCAMGASYGGYAALMATVRHGDRFRCAVAVAPVTDLAAQMRHYQRIGNNRGYAEWRHMVGDPESASAELRARSPIYHAGSITTPVLLIHGGKDRVVDPVHSRSVQEVLQRHGRESTLMLLPDAGHEFRHVRDRRKLYGAAAAFVSRHTQTNDFDEKRN